MIDKYGFGGTVACQVVSTWNALTDTATINIPKKINWNGTVLNLSDNPIIKKGQKVSIAFGLNGNNNDWFTGFISQVFANKEAKINCQDEMFLLKTGDFTKSYESVKLSKLLKEMIGGKVKYEVTADFDLGQLRITRATPAQVLETLRKDYLVKSFVRAGTLYVGLAVVPKLQKRHEIKYVIESDLEYVRKEDTKIRIKGIILNSKNEKKEFEYGDKDGELRTIHAYNISEKELKKMCENEIETLRYSGFKGTFTTFIKPFVNHGDIIKLPKMYDVDTEGAYLVKTVTRSFDGTAARQIIELDRKI